MPCIGKNAKLQYNVLRSYRVEAWLDRNEILPGQRWKEAIRRAIRGGSYYLACFSQEYFDRDRSYMNEELTVAIEELRQRPTDRAWFIPVVLSGSGVPDRDIGGGSATGHPMGGPLLGLEPRGPKDPRSGQRNPSSPP